MAHPASASGSFVRAYVCIIEVSTPYLSHGITRLDFSACCNRTMTRPRVNQKALPSSGPCLLIPVYKLHQGKEANKNCDRLAPGSLAMSCSCEGPATFSSSSAPPVAVAMSG
uniref:Uncharacterized protein n=1 Tax=Fusarium oxysporum (strain Fo5176) TaxID=660025 RepID=A0A0D2XWH4_FUSOF